MAMRAFRRYQGQCHWGYVAGTLLTLLVLALRATEEASPPHGDLRDRSTDGEPKLRPANIDAAVHAHQTPAAFVLVPDDYQTRPGRDPHRPPRLEGGVDVLLTSDMATLAGMVAAINSVVVNLRSETTLRFHAVVDSDRTSAALKAWLKSYHPQLSLDVRVFDGSLVEGRIMIRGQRKELASPLNYARYFAARMFPDIGGRLVFLDSDVIVQGDIWELYALPFEKDGHVAAFAIDCEFNHYEHFFNMDHPLVQVMGVDPNACAFNAGVFVADMAEWRRQNITGQLVAYLEENTRTVLYGAGRGGGGSQPPMLLAFYGRHSDLPPAWHVRHLGWWAGERHSDAHLANAKLLHWNGKTKPWMRTASARLGKIWLKYALRPPPAVRRLLSGDAAKP